MPRPYSPNDKWSRRAAEEGYRARSVYKLQELDQKFRLIRKGSSILDLGAAPGSWLQYIAEKNPRGTNIGIDLQDIDPIDNAHVYTGDITDTKAVSDILSGHDCTTVDCIVSDLAPATSGIRDIDQWRSIELSQAVLDVARIHLRDGGLCVIKVLRGADFDEFFQECKQEWKYPKVVIAKASRDRSSEVYVVLKK